MLMSAELISRLKDRESSKMGRLSCLTRTSAAKLKYLHCDVVSKVVHHIPHLGLDCRRFRGLILLGLTAASGD